MSAQIKPLSRQRQWQLDRQAENRCFICGSPKSAGDSQRHRCEPCAERLRNQQRKQTGCSPWRLGGRGQPPHAQKAAALSAKRNRALAKLRARITHTQAKLDRLNAMMDTLAAQTP